MTFALISIVLVTFAFELGSLLHSLRLAPAGHEDEAGFHSSDNRPAEGVASPVRRCLRPTIPLNGPGGDRIRHQLAANPAD